jgi:predicted RNA-binding Zn-ribbon protein involved in translation (DUF1610 family)
MTKKDYVKFADMIADLKCLGTYDLKTLVRVQSELIEIFKEDNEKFDEDKFIDYIHSVTDEKIDGKICPKCGERYTEFPALSRKDNKTEICPDCGTREALEDANLV